MKHLKVGIYAFACTLFGLPLLLNITAFTFDAAIQSANAKDTSNAQQSVKPAVVKEDIDLSVWQDLKTELFDERSINEQAGWLAMDAPYRAHDAALVPITVKATPPKPGQYIKGLTLVIDNNPVPVAAVMQLSPKLGPLNMETRIRVNQYSHVRAILEMNNGELYMVSKYVKAAGGCSAPAMKDMDAKMASIGQMKMRQFTQKQPADAAQSTREIQLMVRHPNYSGMQLNQVTGYYIPAHFVSEMEIKLEGEPLIKLEGAISLSEDPTIRFQFQSAKEQPELDFVVRDTNKKLYEKKWQLKPVTKVGS